VETRWASAGVKTRAPKLVFEFEDGGSTLEVRLPPPNFLPESEIQERLNQARKESPPMAPPSDWQEGLGAVHAAIWKASYFGPSDEQILKYNNDLEGYFERLEEYLRDGHRNDPRSVTLPIRLANRGGGPAERLRISLQFPEGAFATEHDFGADPEPQPPQRPKASAGIVMAERFGELNPPFLPRIPSFNTGPDFDDEHRVVSYRRENLDQHLRLNLDLFAYFGERPVESFHVDCEVTTSSSPDRQTHRLNVHVVRDDDRG
jgi:hypothetical protein